MLDLYLRVNQAVWRRLPPGLLNSRIFRWHGSVLHQLVCRRAQRQQYFGTFFLRNRPELEQLVRLIRPLPAGAPLKIAVLGCSAGAEVYSVLWSIRTARPDLRVQVVAVDISAEIVRVAQSAVYTPESSELQGRSVFERLTEAEKQAMFDWQGERATVKQSLREGISWRVGDATDPGLVEELGPQDIIVASNFLCHMPPAIAEACLRNIARLGVSRGHLFVTGVDLEVRQKVSRSLGWQPLPELIREMHDGDPSVRLDWPWAWWGLEPLNDRRRDWQLRYAVAFQLP
jgi:hypothetical protein